MIPRSVLSLLALVAVVPTLAAQRTWLVPQPDRAAGIELSTGFYENDVTSGFTAAFTPSVRFPVGGGILATAELPISRASVRPNFLGGDQSATVIGNPWLGLELPVAGTGRLEVGVRPGLRDITGDAEQSAALFGTITEYDRAEAWTGKTTTVRGMLHLGRVPAEGAFVTGRVGATTFIPSGTGGDVEVLANYGLRAGFVARSTLFYAAVTGRALMTSESGSVADRSVHQLGIGVEALDGDVRPHLGVRIFVDELVNNVDAILTAGITWGW